MSLFIRLTDCACSAPYVDTVMNRTDECDATMPLKPCANTTIAGEQIRYATITKYTPRVYIGTARVDASGLKREGLKYYLILLFRIFWSR